jgi:hypothetical protein
MLAAIGLVQGQQAYSRSTRQHNFVFDSSKSLEFRALKPWLLASVTQAFHPPKPKKGTRTMTNGTLVAGPLSKIGRTELVQIPVPQATATHRPVPHHEIVEALVETLSFRHIAVVNEEYAASNDGMKMFGVLDLETQMEGCRFSIGIRNSHDKSLRLGLTAGLRVFVCSNMAFSGDFTPVLAKHSKSFNLIDTLAVGVDRIQRNFEPMQRQVEHWREAQLTDERAKLIFYFAFVDGKLDAPRSLLPEVHRLYFEPQYEEFSPRTMWSLSNAFTSAFKKLDPVPQFKATAKLGEFLNQLPA